MVSLHHVAPLGWEHIALTGDYVWANGSATPDFRPLRDSPSAFMARAGSRLDFITDRVVTVP